MSLSSPTHAEVEREIFHRLAHYTRCIDAKDWAPLSEVFAADCGKCRLSLDGLTREAEIAGRDAIIEDLGAGLGACGATQHLLGNHCLTLLDGANAQSRTYVRAFHRGVGPKQALWLDVMGEYLITWRHTSDGWRAVRWTLRILDSIGDHRAVSPAP